MPGPFDAFHCDLADRGNYERNFFDDGLVGVDAIGAAVGACEAEDAEIGV